MKKTFKYNYIIAGADGFYEVGYKDIMKLTNVSYHTSFYDGFKNFLLRKMAILNFSKKVNNIIKTPFSRIVYPRLFPFVFEEDKPLCFVFFRNYQPVYQSSYINYIRAKYKNSKTVLIFQDTVASNNTLDWEIVRNNIDLLISYDKGDCVRYGMLYHPTPMSLVEIEDDPSIEESDVYFCGRAKGRYPLVQKVYKQLVNLGLRCDFHLIDMPQEAAVISGIQYSSKPFGYMENLQHVKKTKCIIEIMQDGADGFTPRLWESIIYDKHLLSNNKFILDSGYYSDKNIQIMEGEIDPCIKKWINDDVKYSDSYKQELSPVRLLEFIDNNL